MVLRYALLAVIEDIRLNMVASYSVFRYIIHSNELMGPTLQ